MPARPFVSPGARVEDGGQSTRFQRCFSPSTIWVPGIQTQAIRLRGKHLYLTSPRASPYLFLSSEEVSRNPGLPGTQWEAEDDVGFLNLEDWDHGPVLPHLAPAPLSKVQSSRCGIPLLTMEKTLWGKKEHPVHHLAPTVPVGVQGHGRAPDADLHHPLTVQQSLVHASAESCPMMDLLPQSFVSCVGVGTHVH